MESAYSLDEHSMKTIRFVEKFTRLIMEFTYLMEVKKSTTPTMKSLFLHQIDY